MDNTFIKNDVIERYVLNQLNDEELATFRGQLMFDENLRKQVVETKMLMRGLAAIASEGAVANPNTPVAAPASRSNTTLRAAMVIGLFLLAGMTYYFVSSSNTDATDSSGTQEEISTTPVDDATNDNTEEAIPQDNSSEDANETEETKPSDDAKKEQIFADNKANQPKSASKKLEPIAQTTESIASADEEMPFGEPLEKPSFFDDDKEKIGYVVKEEKVNHYIEDAIDNATTKGRMGVVEIYDFENGEFIDRDVNGFVVVDIKGAVDTKAGNNKQYVFKLFDNDEDKFIENMPLYQEHLKPQLFGAEKQPFNVKAKIDLKPGLYYFTVEEEIDDDQDMIYAGRFYVQAGKFEVKDK